jgi:diguanylate cyclase (GGDEF)-like protein
MFKRGLIATAFLFLAIIAYTHSQGLRLAFFVFLPMLLIALLFFFEEDYRRLLPYGVFLWGAIFLVFFIRFPSFEKIVLGAGCVGMGFWVWSYHGAWKRKVAAKAGAREVALGELEALKQKHQSRLESLHHLEKQVAGLLDLFEIARDFNDCLSFETMAGIFSERVMPELAFTHLELILIEKKPDGEPSYRLFEVGTKEAKRDERREELTEREKRWVEDLKTAKTFLQDGCCWIFPLMVDGGLSACFVVEGAQADDLAKFEVLAAYMTLQVKKIRLYETVKELSIQDGLTGVFVRRHFLERFDEELKRSIKFNLPLTVLMLDIDHFKRYNDAHGHLAGDATLRQVASLLRESLRKVDIVARYGGEEFIIVTPETRGEIAAEVAERIRSNIARHNFKIYNDETRVTVSIGAASFPEDVHEWPWKIKEPELAAHLIAEADKALYRAKEEGRNRVVLFREL